MLKVKRHGKLRIKMNDILLILTLMSVFIPMSFCYISSFYLYIHIARLIRVALLILTVADVLFIKRTVPYRSLKMFLFCIVFFATTVINEGSLVNYYDNFSSIMLLSLVVEERYYRSTDEKAIDFVKLCFGFFYIALTINLVFMIKSPTGVYRVVFDEGEWHRYTYAMHVLQTDNRLIEFLLPLSMFSVMCFAQNVVKKRHIIISLIVIVITTVLTKSLTTYFGIAVFFVLTFLFAKKGIKPRTASILVMMLFAVQVIFEFIMTQPIVLGAISFIFGRIDTILSRYLLGVKALEMFKSQPIIGYGTANAGRYFTEGAVTYWVHNLSWDLLIQGGIVGYIAFLNYVIPRTKHSTATNKIPLQYSAISAAMISLMLMGNTESFVYSIEFYLIASLFDVEYWV